MARDVRVIVASSILAALVAGCDGAKPTPPPARPAAVRYFRDKDGMLWTNFREIETSDESDYAQSMKLAADGEVRSPHTELPSAVCPPTIGDAECARTWRATEDQNQRTEFLALSAHEDEIAHVIASGDVYAGLALLRDTASSPMATSQFPRHQQERRSSAWAQWFDCSDAIRMLRSWISDAGSANQSRFPGESTPQQGIESEESIQNTTRVEYLKAATSCETRLGLSHRSSRLRTGPIHIQNAVAELPDIDGFTTEMTPIAGLPPVHPMPQR